MSSSKYINIICILITAAAVIITILFMNGDKFGINEQTSDGYADSEGIFSDRDLDASWDDSSAVRIDVSDMENLTDQGAYCLNGNLYLVSKGTYVLSGNLTEHQVIVDAKNAKLQIVLDGVDIENETLSAIRVKKADKVFITLADGSENTISVGDYSSETSTDDVDAAIFSMADLTINGSGSLCVTASSGDGIKTKEDLVITGGDITVCAENNALLGKDSVRVCDGTFDLTAGRDGIKANNDSNSDKGYVTITGGDFTIVSENDGIQAETDLNIAGGEFDITSGGGASNGQTHTDEMDFGGGFGGGRSFNDRGGDTPQKPDSTEDAEAGSDGDEMPDMGDMPQMPEAGSDGDKMPDMGDAPQMPEAGSDGDEMPDMGDAPQMPEAGSDGDKMPEAGNDGDKMPDMSEIRDKIENGEIELPDGFEMPDSTEMPDMGDMPQMPEAGNDGDKKPDMGDMPQMDGDMADDSDADSDTDTSASDSHKGIKAGGTITISDGTIKLDCADDGIHSNGDVSITDGNINIVSGDDGVHADDSLTIDGGNLTVAQSYEGLEANQITINGGNIDITSSDDGMNACGGTSFGMMGFMGGMDKDKKGSTTEGEADNETDYPSEDNPDDDTLPTLRITGGTITVDAGGDGLDSNGDLIVDGGNIIVAGPADSANGALDAGTESGGDCVVNGGTIIAYGASGMAETFTDNSSQYSFMCSMDSSFSAGDTLTITSESGETIYSCTLEKSGNSVVFSSPDLKDGTTYTVAAGGVSCEVTIDGISNKNIKDKAFDGKGGGRR